MVPKITQAGYNHLRLIHYFTAGEDKVKCWTICEDTKAPGAASVIHTDFERGFICVVCSRWRRIVDSWRPCRVILTSSGRPKKK
jgi:obg-like ATPase 1